MTAPSHAEIVIIGGGIIGCSIAYHLTRMGKRDVLILEKSGITHGATWHAAGLVGQLRSSRNVTRMLQRSVELYDRLEQETGQAIDWKKVGSLRLACSEERLLEIKRSATMAKSFGLEMEIITAREAQRLFPLMSTDGVLAAAFLPSDGYVDPASVAQALAKGARVAGARILEGVRVTGISTQVRRATLVHTENGDVGCEILVNAAGMWGREVGQMAGLRVPALALEHQYLVSDPIPDMPKNMPTLRDPDLLVYYKPEVRGIAVGGYEPDTKPFGERGIPKSFARELLGGNFDRFEQLALLAAKRTPILEKIGVRQLINGPIPYSADSDFIMGKAPELDNCYVAAGFLYGIAAGGGAGRMMAEWIVEGAPSLDLWPLDVRRFAFHHNTRRFMYPRAIELYGHHYKIHYPGLEHASARGIRRSPLYEALKQKGAVFGSKAGWERPNWFAYPDIEAIDRPSFRRPNWFEPVAGEHRAVRERVALIDQSSFSKFELSGPGALAALDKLAAARMDRPIGSVIYTQLCNERGGIECDLTITRLAEDRFYIVTGSGFAVHDSQWIGQHLPTDGSARLADVTSSHAVINLCGPLARRVLERLSEQDVSNPAFPFATGREITLGAAPVLAIRIGYVGELGWELHVPTEYAAHVYECLWEAGAELGIADVGYRAIDSLRMEKGYLYWSADITPDYDPYEAGLGFRVARDKEGFIGYAALRRIRQDGPRRRLAIFTLEKPLSVFGGEAILHQGRVVSVTTSGNFGHSIGKPIVYGYLPIELAMAQGFAVEAFGEQAPATRHDGPLYDPDNERLKC
jgi:glycine cleavage system aminomethyltransferase T/glycine/D-amino acid oxidase-like deaminating enzyme